MSVAGAPMDGPALPPPPLPRLLPPGGGPLPLAGHIGRYGPLPSRRHAAGLIAEVGRAGLTGRGGAGFPAARKMQAVAEAATSRARLLSVARSSIVVANGVESEPVSGKDTMLLGLSPHLVLDGIAAAAAAVGASRAYLCVHSGRPELVGLLRLAVTERERAGLCRVPIQVAEVPGGYLASQETALVSFLNGGPQRPTFIPPRPAERGVQGRPTLVQNVETHAAAGPCPGAGRPPVLPLPQGWPR